MAKITISDIHISSNEESLMIALTEQELESVSGGIISVLVICFAAGYGVGTLIYRTCFE